MNKVRDDFLAKRVNGDLKFSIPDVEHGTGVYTDQEKYYSREVMEREWENLWSKTWTMAGRVSDLKRVGDWFTFELGRESFIIVRAADDSIKAFYNVCQHRGSRLVHEDFGRDSSFVCSFHSWAWNIDGSIKRVTDAETFPEEVLCGNLGLSEVRCETWGGFVFITMDDAAEHVIEFMGSIDDDVAVYHFDRMIVAADRTIEWPVNWKVALEAFSEGYHAHARHPELIQMIDDFNFEFAVYPGGHSKNEIPMGTKSPRIADRSTLTNELRQALEEVGLDPKDFENRQQDVRAAMIKTKREWSNRFGLDIEGMTDGQLLDDRNFNIFPNVTFNIHPEGMLAMRFRPHATDPGRCYYDIWVLAMPCGDPDFVLPDYMSVPSDTDLSGNGPRPKRDYLDYEKDSVGFILDQDGDFLPLVQAGVQSRGFKGVRLGDQELRVRHFYEEYDRHMKGLK